MKNAEYYLEQAITTGYTIDNDDVDMWDEIELGDKVKDLETKKIGKVVRKNAKKNILIIVDFDGKEKTIGIRDFGAFNDEGTSWVGQKKQKYKLEK